MAKEILQYSVMVETALRAVVRQSLAEVAADGLPGKHHFYITFRTGYPGVQVPEYLKARYPGEMTIVLQFQFYDLQVDDKAFSVTLTFNNAPERLIIPLRAITVFADPSVNFVLPFQATEAAVEAVPTKPASKSLKDFVAEAVDKSGQKAGEAKSETRKIAATKPAEDGEKTGAVVSLDKFRKK